MAATKKKQKKKQKKKAGHSPEGLSRVWRALLAGLAKGFERHVPTAVGIVARGVPICAMLAFNRLVLELDWPTSFLFAALVQSFRG